MKRLATGLAIVLALVLMLAAIATAAPENCEELPVGNPHYCGTTTSSSTTSTTTTMVLGDCGSENTIHAVKGPNALNCEWTPTEPEDVGDSTVGMVTVTVDKGEIGGLAIFVLDSMPGNICELVQINKPTALESASFYLVEGTDTYWNTGGADWCAQYDEFGPKEDLNGEPLHVRVLFRAKGDTDVTISLTPEQEVVVSD